MIESVEHLSLVQPNETVGSSGLRSRKALAFFVVLVLSGVALVFADGEARAQQQRPALEVHATVTGPERAPVAGAGIAPPAFAEPVTGTLPAEPSSSQVDERDAGFSSSPEPVPDPVTPGEPEPALALLEEFYPAYWTDLLPEAAMPKSFGITPGTDPAYDPAVALLDPGPVPDLVYPVPFVEPPPAPGPAGFGAALPYLGTPEPAPARGLVGSEAYKPPSPRIEEKSPVLSLAGTPSGVRPAPLQENGVAKAVPVGPLPPVADRKVPPPGLALQEPAMPGPPVTGPSREAALLLSSLEAAASSAVERLHGAAADVSEALAPGDKATVEPYSGGRAKEPSEDAPPLLSPASLGGSYFSPSAGGQVGPGGIVPLLTCVLAAGLILLRPVGRLSWASCQPPKPSSVLLGPRERPG
ncbi:MAG: hypothetical protein AVDCRST_MAG80-1642 [uncultured Rubrobacteraceae bacterium]|uniref:Uncharacterized protein n=1 Tax=uncultured Rubrobacteraceae bacterium TaxID=349277 RepID=A0A6J4QLX3_9ACTN|nr:MAG: hypothetical protein AVDCRST_MAG80-1642 [uncultured Rubrobacteraceae bacterium]